jgi:L-aspartate oxidase
MSPQHSTDVLVIGSGAAGLTLALQLADKAHLRPGRGRRRAGPGRLHRSHIADTWPPGPDCATRRWSATPWSTAGGHRNPDRPGRTLYPGAEGRRPPGYHLTREGGHSHRRVIHAADATGNAIENGAWRRSPPHPQHRVCERHIAVDLITGASWAWTTHAAGAYVLDRHAGHVEVFRARNVVLATGGASKVYLYTSNPDTRHRRRHRHGLARRLPGGQHGVHAVPSHLPLPSPRPSPSSSPRRCAARGAAAAAGRHPLHAPLRSPGELAPRDIVARAIDHEMKRLGADHVYLDISHKPAEFIKEHFPTIYAQVPGIRHRHDPGAAPRGAGGPLHLRRHPTDLHGRTDVPGLYAIGEVRLHRPARRQPHGQQLAAGVPGVRRRRQRGHHRPAGARFRDAPGCRPGTNRRVTDSDEEVVVSHNWDELRRFMWDYVGIVRTDKRLQRAKRRVDLLQQEIAEYYGNFRVTNDLLELRNLVGGGSDHPLGPGTQGKPRPALHPRLPASGYQPARHVAANSATPAVRSAPAATTPATMARVTGRSTPGRKGPRPGRGHAIGAAVYR